MAEESKTSEKTLTGMDKLNAIDEAYNKSIANRIGAIGVKKAIAQKAGTSSATKIAGLRGLRGLEPRFGQQFSSKKKY